MPMPAGTGLTRRTFMSRAAGMAFAVYGAASLGPKAFEAGIAEAAAAAPDQRILVSVFLSGGADSLGVLAPTGDPRYASLRPTLKLSPDEGTAVRRRPRPALAPRGGGPGHAPRRGQAHGDAGDRLHRRQPVPLHEPALLRGGGDQPVRPLGLARPVPRPARHRRQPAPGPDARATSSSPRWPRATCPWPPWRARTTTTSTRPGCGTRSPTPMLDAFGDAGRAAHHGRGLAYARGRPWPRPGACAASSRPSRTASARRWPTRTPSSAAGSRRSRR